MNRERRRSQGDQQSGTYHVKARAEPDSAFDRFTRLAARLVNAPVSWLTLIDDGQTNLASGFHAEDPHLSELFASTQWLDLHLTASKQHLAIADITTSDLTQGNEFLTQAGIRAYLSIPLASDATYPIGTLSVADTRPRDWTEDEIAALEDLAVPLLSEIHQHHSTSSSPIHLPRLRQNENYLEQLWESEVRKSAMFEAALDCIITIDHEGRVVEFNAAAERTFGYPREVAIGQLMADLIMPADQRKACLTAFSTHLETGSSAILGRRIERQAMRADGSIIDTEMAVARIDLPGQQHPLFTAYLRDITEQKKAEAEIRRFIHMVDAVGQAVIANDNSPERRITYWNPAAEEILGWTADEALGRGFYELVPPQDFWDDVRAIGADVRQGQHWQGEFRLRHKDGHTIPALASVTPILDDEGNLLGVVSAYSDTTELKRTEQDIRFFKHTVEAIGEAVVATSLDGKITYTNRAAEQMLGWNAGELIGKSLLETIPDQSRIEEAREIAAHIRTGEPWFSEFSLQQKDGSTFPALISLAPMTNELGETTGVISVYSEITELKQSEQALRFHKHIVDAVGQAVVVSNSEGHIVYWNKAAEDIYGWSYQETLGHKIYTVLPAPSDVDIAVAVLDQVAAGSQWAGEALVRHKNGTEFPAYFTVSPIRDSSGEIVGIIGVSHDISDQKEYERQIEFHKIMLDAVGQTIVTTDQNRIITYWSKGAEHALGWTAEEVLGRSIADIAPAAHLKEEAGKLHKSVREGSSWIGQFPIRRKDGSTFPAVVSLAPVTLTDQRAVGVIGVYTDISELKQTEAELRLHKHMLDAVGQAVLATDQNLRVTYWNRAAEELYGYSAAEAIGTSLLDFLPSGSDEWQQAANAIDFVFEQGHWSGELLTHHKNGHEIAALVNASPILAEDGTQIGLIVALADITERRQIEIALKESNEETTEILETMGDGFISLDRDWRMQYVNRQAEQILNRKREDLLGRNLWDEFPESDEQPFFRRFSKAFETGQPLNVTEYDENLDMWLEVHASPSRERLEIFFRDVTERRSREVALREAEERYRTLVEQLPAISYIAQADDLRTLTYVSPQIEQMLGYTPDEWLFSPRFWSQYVHPDDLDFVLSQDAKTVHEGRDRSTLEYRLQAADGTWHWIRETVTLIRRLDGKPSYWQGLAYDITQEKRTERTIRESEQRFRSLFDNHPDAVFSIDPTGLVLSANPAFVEMTGYSTSQTDPLHFVDLVVPENKKQVRTYFAETNQGKPQEFRSGIIDPGGKRIELNLTTIPIIVEHDIVGVHVVAQDVTIHQELENQLAHQAYHDSLTGLPNRNLFQNKLSKRLEDAREHNDQFAVLFFDLDDFKVINDSLGHSAGDQLLVEVAQRVQTCIRSGDTIARLGGDEFTLLLEHVQEQNDAIVIAKRIAEVLDNVFYIDDHEVFATTSIGIALGDANSPSSDDILRNADLAMYEAKNSGKDRYALFEPSMNSRAWLRLTLESEIRRGIPRNEFRVYYQPIVDINTGHLEGVEALVRWEHPERGFLEPSDFIAVAEQSGLILPLGRWIIREATTQLHKWQELTPDGRPVKLSLNLSPKQYRHPRLIEELTNSLKNAQLDPRLITLEITENMALDDSSETIKTLQHLKDIGVQLALDDFGTGFSALSYLRRFPIDIIKIDRTFVNGLGTDPEDTTIVKVLMAASLAMRMKVTAEGIETVSQLNMLRELGCHFGQGYLFSKPLEAEAMEERLKSQGTNWINQIYREPE